MSATWFIYTITHMSPKKDHFQRRDTFIIHMLDFGNLIVSHPNLPSFKGTRAVRQHVTLPSSNIRKHPRLSHHFTHSHTYFTGGLWNHLCYHTVHLQHVYLDVFPTQKNLNSSKSWPQLRKYSVVLLMEDDIWATVLDWWCAIECSCVVDLIHIFLICWEFLWLSSV